ncbi:hypothetical protein [Roseateles sp. BYS87W]|uniref:Uncharacterized protein n=1 Tax=Pelomonas baiyunensis TaxID=3299026 RepID=A0ABW7GUG1_9BURK
MSALDCSVAGPDQAHFGPVFLITTIASGLAALVGVGLALAGKHGADIVLQTTGTLATWLAGSVFWMAGTQASAEARWQRRVTPSAAARRTRQGYAELRLQLVACASAGPAVMLVGQACVLPAGEVLSLTATCALQLAAAWLVGTWLGLRVSVDRHAHLQRALTALTRLLGGWRLWRRVPTLSDVELERNNRGALVWLVLLPQSLTQAPNWRFLAWGEPLAEGWALAWLGVWMFALCMVADAVTVGPPLHWRARLAPGRLAPAAWARRMVAASLLSALAWMVFELAVAAWLTGEGRRDAQFQSWLPVSVDALLAMAWSLWVRGWRNTGPAHLLASVSLAVAVPGLVAVVHALGFSPVRGLELLGLELAAAVALAAGAQRAWAKQDLNRFVPMSTPAG